MENKSDKNFDVVTLGETMLRLSPPGALRLEQASQLEMNFGGAEANVAVNLARLGKRVMWFSRLPDNPLGQQCAAALQKHGVDVSRVVWSPNERMGLYFVEYGQPPRAIRVWYDRANSAASHMTPNELPLDAIALARWLHLTGITPALSQNCAETVHAAIDFAAKNAVTISFDVNYRKLFWDAAACAATLEPLCQKAHYVILALRDAHSLWHVEGDAAQAAQTLQARWGGTVIVTWGDKGAAACDGQDSLTVPAVPTSIVDRLGAGDAFVSGVICQLLENAPLQDALRFGTAVAALKLGIVGDVAVITRQEVETLLQNIRRDLER
jgi:2-dehydro-3-deoxygluconokinase